MLNVLRILIKQNCCAMACESYVQRFLFIKIKKLPAGLEPATYAAGVMKTS